MKFVCRHKAAYWQRHVQEINEDYYLEVRCFPVQMFFHNEECLDDEATTVADCSGDEVLWYPYNVT